MELCRSLSHWHVIDIIIMLLITCKGSKKELQNSHYVFYIKNTNISSFIISESCLIHYRHGGVCSVYSQSSFNVGPTVLKIRKHSKTKQCFPQQEWITIPENLNSKHLPAVSRNNINLNPRIFIYSSVNKIYQHGTKTFSGNVKQGLTANSTFAAIINEFYVLILKHIQELHNVKSYIWRQYNVLLYFHTSKQFSRQLKIERLM